jgi:transcription antitermination factor NusG
VRAISHYSENHWFALCTKPRCEFKAKKQLDYLETRNYLPIKERFSKWSDRTKKIVEPIIRGYIFIYGDERARLLALEQTSVVKCICQGGRAACIPDWQIENLKKIEKNSVNIKVLNGLVCGKKVEVIDGPLKGVIGTIEKVGCQHSLVISIDLLNRSIIVHLSDANLVKSI